MKHGKVVHVSELRVGDVARMIHGSTSNRKEAEGSIGSLDDFREGYDTMTVCAIDGENLTFQRPHIEIYREGEQRVNVVTVGVELVAMVNRAHSGLWYELLGLGPNHTDTKREREEADINVMLLRSAMIGNPHFKKLVEEEAKKLLSDRGVDMSHVHMQTCESCDMPEGECTCATFHVKTRAK